MLQAKQTEHYLTIEKTTKQTEKKTGLQIIKSPNGIKRTNNLEKSERVDVLATVKEYVKTDMLDIKFKSDFSKQEIHVVYLIDSSGSMIKDKQIACIKGLIQQTMEQYKQKRLKYSVIALNNGEAQLLTASTIDSACIIEAIDRLTTGGKTNMKAGFILVKELMKTNTVHTINLYIFTDGKINAGDTKNPFNEAVSFYKTFLKSINQVNIIDNENGFVKLGLSEKLATEIGARYIRLTNNIN